MRLLLTITTLLLSTTAFAEVWFCQTEKEAGIQKDFHGKINNPDPNFMFKFQRAILQNKDGELISGTPPVILINKGRYIKNLVFTGWEDMSSSKTPYTLQLHEKLKSGSGFGIRGTYVLNILSTETFRLYGASDAGPLRFVKLEAHPKLSEDSEPLQYVSVGECIKGG